MRISQYNLNTGNSEELVLIESPELQTDFASMAINTITLHGNRTSKNNFNKG